MIYGDRIRQAREYCGLTQTELAQKIPVNQSLIALSESGRYIPTPDVLAGIARETGFLASFFEKEPAYDFPLGTLVFRARSSLTSREIDQAHQHANVLFEHMQRMAEKFWVPGVNVPVTGEGPVKAAAVTRAAFAMSPDIPVRRLLITLEKNGVFVLALPVVLQKIDAFSTWAEAATRRPVIAISSGRPTDRIRFSVAHELGHLVMHRIVTTRVAEMERDANKFAAEFLLPEKAMRREILRPVTLTSVAKLKLRWNVSMQALIYRAHELDIITERQYRYLFEQLSARGWRTNEPPNLNGPEEKPRLLAKMIEQLYGDSNVVEALSKDMGVSQKGVVEMLNEHLAREVIPIKEHEVTPGLDMLSRN